MKRPRRYSTPSYDFHIPCEFKKQYENEKDALEAAELRMLDNMRIELTVYKCPVCHYWHLTRVKPDASSP